MLQSYAKSRCKGEDFESEPPMWVPNIQFQAILKPFSNEKDKDESTDALPPLIGIDEEDEDDEEDSEYDDDDDDDVGMSSDPAEEDVPDEVLAEDINKVRYALTKVCFPT